ncbi:hypothetical protein F4859DRAFT_410663 [Xylaria cf. heliscus]|nr:hypothetical protein F4859DRAFT_410663 [Xylaria cf. heliscus]
MDAIMDLVSRRPRELAPMPGGFPTYLEAPPRQRSTSRPGVASDTDTTYNQPPSQPKPPRGILKNSPSRLQENRLAARFYRVPRPVQTHQAPMHSPHSPTYYASDNSTYAGYDGETDVNSTSSELSVNTQATSVASDYSSDYKRSRPSVHVRHVRPVPLPTTVSRVRARPRTRAPSEVSRSEVTKGPSQSSGRRTVHIQIIPNKTARSDPQSMQLARIPGRELVHKLEQLESDTEDLRHVRKQLVRRLDDTSEELSMRLFENKQIARALHQERNTKELILRDLEEQRKLFDEFRSNFEWQKSVLVEVERERDSLREARGDAEKKLVDLEKDMSEREQKQQEQDELLRQQITKLAIATGTLEEKVTISDEKLKSVATERDDLQALSKQYQVQLKVLREMKKPAQDERNEAEELQRKLQFKLNRVTIENRVLQDKITNLEDSIVVFRAQINDFEVAKKDLENTLASERASKGSLEKSLSADNAEIVKQLSADKDTLEKQLLADKDDLEKQLIAEREELEKRLETTIVDLGKQLQATRDALGMQIEDTKNALEKQLEDTKVTLETQREAHRVEREDLQQKIDASEAAKNDLENQLAAAKEELGKEIAGAKDELETKGASWKVEKDDKQSTIDGLITELAGAKNANIALATQRLEIEKKLVGVEANLVAVQAELTDLKATHQTLVSDNEQLKTQNGDLTQKAADLDKLQTEKTAEIQKLQGEHAVLDERIKGLQAALNTAQAARDSLRDEKREIEAHVKELEDGSPILVRLRVEKADLEAQLSALQGKADQVPTLEQANTQLEQTKAVLEGRIAIAQGEASLIPGLRDQIERLNGQIRDMQNAANTRPNRTPSRSTSRAPSKRHGRSPSSSSGFLFVRNPSEKGGQVYITTRDALSKEKEKGE